MKALHPVFNVVKLLSAPKDPIPGRPKEHMPPLTLIDDQGGEHFEVEAILDSCFLRNKLHFLVKWKGYGYEDNQWISEGNLDAPDLLREFYEQHPGAPRQLPTGQFDSLIRPPSKRRGAAPRRGSCKGNPSEHFRGVTECDRCHTEPFRVPLPSPSGPSFSSELPSPNPSFFRVVDLSFFSFLFYLYSDYFPFIYIYPDHCGHVTCCAWIVSHSFSPVYRVLPLVEGIQPFLFGSPSTRYVVCSVVGYIYSSLDPPPPAL